jgi:DNA-binding transcriptional LysR family regulator
MELRHLRYFVAVAEELNFTRAAARLHIAQPPLSTQIRALEGELGVDLFLREKRRVYLTQAGEELLGRARLILRAAHDAGVAARSAASGIIGRVTLGYVASAMFSDRLPAVIRRFQRNHPHIEWIRSLRCKSGESTSACCVSPTCCCLKALRSKNGINR